MNLVAVRAGIDRHGESGRHIHEIHFVSTVAGLNRDRLHRAQRELAIDAEPFAGHRDQQLVDPQFGESGYNPDRVVAGARARRRGARIYCEVVGYAMTSDAFHITAPPDDGEGAIRCMELAIRDAGISKDDIGYINAHATSTFADKVETEAIKRVFGERAYRIPVSSTKSMTGHLLGASGGVEAAFCVLAIHDGLVPPTTNLEHPDPECDLDYVPGQARSATVRVAMSNSFGFGGVNACLLFKRVES